MAYVILFVSPHIPGFSCPTFLDQADSSSTSGTSSAAVSGLPDAESGLPDWASGLPDASPVSGLPIAAPVSGLPASPKEPEDLVSDPSLPKMPLFLNHNPKPIPRIRNFQILARWESVEVAHSPASFVISSWATCGFWVFPCQILWFLRKFQGTAALRFWLFLCGSAYQLSILRTCSSLCLRVVVRAMHIVGCSAVIQTF